MKLKNMPVPKLSLVDEYMAPILEAAKTGDFSHKDYVNTVRENPID